MWGDILLDFFFLNRSFLRAEVFNLHGIHSVTFCTLCFLTCLRNLCLAQCHKDFLLHFLQKLRDITLTLRSIVHFELRFLHAVTYDLKWIFSIHIDYCSSALCMNYLRNFVQNHYNIYVYKSYFNLSSH